MANLADHKAVNLFSNERKIYKVEYDFANDAGATGILVMLTATVDIVIHTFYARGITVLDSAGDGVTIDVGVTGGDINLLLDGVAEATFAAGALIQPFVVDGTPPVQPLPVVIPAGGSIEQLIIGEALTSGKCQYVFDVSRFN